MRYNQQQSFKIMLQKCELSPPKKQSGELLIGMLRYGYNDTSSSYGGVRRCLATLISYLASTFE